MTGEGSRLTARVIVNRLWQHHFGRGIVASPSDFGRLGERPSHPELLDWLTRRFLDEGWSLKALHRRILLSSAYRQSSRGVDPGRGRMVDPETRLLWRMPVRRLEAEAIRDSLLMASGELDLTMSGPSVPYAVPRRAVYLKAYRNAHDPVLDSFDAPDGFLSMAVRNVSTTATQSLLMVNSAWTLARAQAMAARLEAEGLPDVNQRIDRVFELALGRPASDIERAEATQFLREQAGRSGVWNAEAEDEHSAGWEDVVPTEVWVDFCHVLMNSSEFLYVD
jgi:hypothetical protein